jgi:hypothetical protein
MYTKGNLPGHRNSEGQREARRTYVCHFSARLRITLQKRRTKNSGGMIDFHTDYSGDKYD